VVDGVRRLRAACPDRAATRAYAEGFGWGETTHGQIRIFRQAAQQAIPDGVLSRLKQEEDVEQSTQAR
jgi:hypothetical protein